MKSADPRLRVVVAAEWFPPAFRAGGPIRSVANLVEVLGQTHEVFVVAGAYDLGSEEEMPELELNAWVQQPWGQVMFVTRDRWTSRLWHHLLIETLQPDFLYLNSLFARFFALSALRVARKRPAMRVVVAPRGMFGPAALAIKPLKKRAFLWAANAFGWFKDVTWHASSDVEAHDIRESVRGPVQLQVAQNLPSMPHAAEKAAPDDRWVVVALGRIHPIKNLLFGIRAMEAAVSMIASPPLVEIRLIGLEEDADLLAQLLQNEGRPKQLSVSHLGALNPNAVSRELSVAHFVLMPSLHENYGHAIVEAWAHGCPVFLSDRTPWSSLANRGLGWDWPLDDATWADGIRNALESGHSVWAEHSKKSKAFFINTVRSPEIIEANRRIFSR